MKWSENTIARALARQFFERKHLVLVPNCSWTGHECDLLVVTRDLRIIDVEVKISRADLKADAKKDKWWRRADAFFRAGLPAPDLPRQHPPKVWKHYYALPAEIWKPELLGCLPSQNSGVLLLAEQKCATAPLVVRCARIARPDRAADRISAGDAIDIARLASLRMWDAFSRLEKLEAA